MANINVCMDCNNEWEEDKAICCNKCGSGNFYTEMEEEK